MEKIPVKICKTVKEAVYRKADVFGYATRPRNENSQFMDELVDDPEIGGVLKEYKTRERIRTYIKDGILNAYTKRKNKQVLQVNTPQEVIGKLCNKKVDLVAKQNTVWIFRSKDNCIHVLGQGTVLKWETALRKALELIARSPKTIIGGKYPFIYIQLAVINEDITDGDITQIRTALSAIGVKVHFCKG